MKKILGIDYGLKRIGLATAEEGVVTPLSVVINSEKIFSQINRLCRENQIEEIVLGLPTGKLEPRVKGFAKKLSTLVGLQVVYQAETLTSKLALAKMLEAGKGQKARREEQDAFAAAIILEDYLKIHV